MTKSNRMQKATAEGGSVEKVMLVDDEISIAKAMSGLVNSAGYQFVHATDGEEALNIVNAEQPDVIVLDVMMPRMDGFTTCRKMREQGVRTPIIFLSAKGDIVDKGVGFDAGGDDYMTKPFDPRELMMHIEAQIRRSRMSEIPASSEEETIIIGRIALDAKRHQFEKDGKAIRLTPKEFTIMHTLVSNPGVVFSKEQLTEVGWGPDFVGETNSITVLVKKLRAKVEDDPRNPRIIETVWGIGYRIDPDACQADLLP